jgi:predicted nucleic acid-binding protein
VKAFVIDASVAIKWVVRETGTQEALSLRQHRLVAPDLLVAECANILWKKVRRKE